MAKFRGLQIIYLYFFVHSFLFIIFFSGRSQRLNTSVTSRGKKTASFNCHDRPVKFFCGVELGNNDKQDCTRKEEKNGARY